MGEVKLDVEADFVLLRELAVGSVLRGQNQNSWRRGFVTRICFPQY